MKYSRRRDSDYEDHGSERWLVSYADFITLMFAFFAVLYATSQKDLGKSKELQDSIKRYLVKAGGGMGGLGDAGPQINQNVKGDSPIESPIPTFNRQKPETVKALDEAEAFVDDGLSKEERTKYILDVAADDWGVRIILRSSALFSGESEKFDGEALPFVDKLGALLKTTKRKILIEGHAAPGETGQFRSTWDFASARAVNMLRYIQKKQGFPAAALASATLGDSRMLFDESDKKAMNSRLEIVLLNQEYEF